MDECKIMAGAVNEILNAAGTLLSADSAGKDKENMSLKFAYRQICPCP